MSTQSLRKRFGCWAHERWKAELVLCFPWLGRRFGISWLDLCNRNESLFTTDHGRARICNWQDTSQLTVCRLFPGTGGRLLHHCLEHWPISFFDEAIAPQSQPDVSIIIAFRGSERLPQLLSCLASLRAQAGCAMEIILVEQSWEPLLCEGAIAGVRYFHARSTSEKMPFNKSWALNVGARFACSEVLIFHDGDMLAPVRYASVVFSLLYRDHQAARIPRLVFYPNKSDSEFIQNEWKLSSIKTIDNVRQNCRGISLAISKQAYWGIGGHDESFYGWGGEDDEILQRIETLRMYPGGFLPFIHLWHPDQKEKHSGMIDREAVSRQKMGEPVAERINRLKQLNSGSIEAPACASLIEEQCG